MKDKQSLDSLAINNGPKLFDKVISTSNLVKPNENSFIDYLSKSSNCNDDLNKLLRSFHEVKYCISTVNGFWALVVCIKELALKGKDEVLLPSFTYRRLADVVAWTGLIPKFCDIENESLGLCPTSVQKNITDRTALIIGVHPIVNCCNSEELESVANYYNIPIVFDGVESVNERINNKKIGSFGLVECFSFHASKLINGFEGGYITTNNRDVFTRLSKVLSPPHESEGIYFDGKLNEIHAGMAYFNLLDIENQIAHNKEIYHCYLQQLKDFPHFRILEFNSSLNPSYKNIVVKIKDSWEFSQEQTVHLLNSEGILARAYYNPPLHLKNLKYVFKCGNLKNTEMLHDKFLLMPSGYQVSCEDIKIMFNFLKFINENTYIIKNFLK